jgi:hypothetical protein
MSRPRGAGSDAKARIGAGAGMDSPDDLQRIFDEAATLKNNHMRDQLAYGHMIALADNFEGWAMDVRMSPVQIAKLLGWAESLRQLAELVGPDWNPPEPERLTLMGFLGRQVIGDEPR